jgi:putative cardiolipin synthase
MGLLGKLRKQGVRVRVLTNSLASTDVPLVHAGYLPYRIPLLQGGTELYEVKPWPGEPNTARGLIKSGSSGAFALHAKVFVIDRQRVFVGSMNFDQRSVNINTEIGLSHRQPASRREIATRFDAIVVPANSYRLVLESGTAGACGAMGKRKTGNRCASSPSRVDVAKRVDRSVVVDADRSVLWQYSIGDSPSPVFDPAEVNAAASPARQPHRA